jgi:hypothetical protein
MPAAARGGFVKAANLLYADRPGGIAEDSMPRQATCVAPPPGEEPYEAINGNFPIRPLVADSV